MGKATVVKISKVTKEAASELQKAAKSSLSWREQKPTTTKLKPLNLKKEGVVKRGGLTYFIKPPAFILEKFNQIKKITMSDKEKVFTSKTGQKYIINTPTTPGAPGARTGENIKEKVKELKK
jgi:hypothetical protein